MEQFPNTHPILAIVFTGGLVSVFGGFVADLVGRLKGSATAKA